MSNRLFCAFTAITLIVTFTLTISAPASIAQVGWRVEPGTGYGPVRLGMGPDEVLRILGTPASRNERQYLLELTYQGSLYRFFAERLDTPQTKRLGHIIVWDRSATTRGGVRVGANLFEVIDVFGDSLGNLQGSGGQDPQYCLDMLVEQAQGPSRLALTVTYRQLGISFGLSLTNSAPRPVVERIVVERPRACRSVVQ